MESVFERLDEVASISRSLGGIGYDNKAKEQMPLEEKFVLLKKITRSPAPLKLKSEQKLFVDPFPKGYWNKKETNIVCSQDSKECFQEARVKDGLKDIVSEEKDSDWFPRLLATIDFAYREEGKGGCIPSSMDLLFQPLDRFRSACRETEGEEEIRVEWFYSRSKLDQQAKLGFPVIWMSTKEDERSYSGLGWEYFAINVKRWSDVYARSNKKKVLHVPQDAESESLLRFVSKEIL